MPCSCVMYLSIASNGVMSSNSYHHVAPDGTEGYSIEVFNAVGDTIAVTVVPATALEPLREDEILCARSVTG